MSKYDTPDEDKWWLSSLYKESAEFVTEGKKVPWDEPSAENPGYSKCFMPKVTKGSF